MRNQSKHVFQFVGLTLVICLSSQIIFAQDQPQLDKLSEEQVDQDDIKYAENLADQILSKMAEGSYYEFGEDEAIPQLTQVFTEETQKQAYQQIKGIMGDYEQSLDYQEAYSLSQGGMKGIVYRFKGEFSKAEPEVRVMMTSDNKLAGFRVLPWVDSLQ
ncbi:hypothetical protein [Catalinimonas niigatensis]|uniref:hypothetical protein n=1 Tax=Catalinimonas niigatensis TaxID=1397264 RepID=UPI002666BF1B|nr:hypothetical protein [Catalinimonas niigatensis]WPP50297.1 hypothetical protein PZB72_26890 [Catalinimonas niigatensis]